MTMTVKERMLLARNKKLAEIWGYRSREHHDGTLDHEGLELRSHQCRYSQYYSDPLMRNLQQADGPVLVLDTENQSKQLLYDDTLAMFDNQHLASAFDDETLPFLESQAKQLVENPQARSMLVDIATYKNESPSAWHVL